MDFSSIKQLFLKELYILIVVNVTLIKCRYIIKI
jgi:hypothetical protein